MVLVADDIGLYSHSPVSIVHLPFVPKYLCLALLTALSLASDLLIFIRLSLGAYISFSQCWAFLIIVSVFGDFQNLNNIHYSWSVNSMAAVVRDEAEGTVS